MRNHHQIQTGEYPVIVGIGSYLPETVVSNEDLIQRTGMDSSDKAIQTLTGIKQRHFCGRDELPSDMGVIASRNAMESARIDPRLIGGLYVSTMTRDMPTPDTAVFMHERLGLPEDSITLDIGGICAGAVMALHEAANRTSADGRPTLAVGLGKMTPATNFGDRRSGILFGDGAGAFVVENRPDAHRPTFHFLTAPHTDAIHVPGGGDRQPLQSPEDIAGKIAMQGRTVAGYATDLMPRAAVEAARKAGLYDDDKERIDWDQITAVVPHQANLRLIEKVGKKLEIPGEKVVVTVDQHGNTSAASIPLALDHAYREGRFDPQKRNRILLIAIGAGMVAGAGIFDLHIPQS